mmetsp:Transcript_7125/g.25387  ORF Transcript_7125/g.25387 Transcript_7125/m.25387 type:complete len:381 (-) Transcript_7125:879-2021(-)
MRVAEGRPGHALVLRANCRRHRASRLPVPYARHAPDRDGRADRGRRPGWSHAGHQHGRGRRPEQRPLLPVRVPGRPRALRRALPLDQHPRTRASAQPAAHDARRRAELVARDGGAARPRRGAARGHDAAHIPERGVVLGTRAAEPSARVDEHPVRPRAHRGLVGGGDGRPVHGSIGRHAHVQHLRRRPRPAEAVGAGRVLRAAPGADGCRGVGRGAARSAGAPARRRCRRAACHLSPCGERGAEARHRRPRALRAAGQQRRLQRHQAPRRRSWPGGGGVGVAATHDAAPVRERAHCRRRRRALPPSRCEEPGRWPERRRRRAPVRPVHAVAQFGRVRARPRHGPRVAHLPHACVGHGRRGGAARHRRLDGVLARASRGHP